MTAATRWRPVRVFLASVAVTLAAILATPIAGETIGSRFLASLRIARPKAVTPGVPSSNAASGNRQLPNVISGILAETSSVVLDEPDAQVPSADSATRAAGFRAQLLSARADSATIEVLGAHRVMATVNRDQLRTLFLQAGRPATIPESLNGTVVTLGRLRGVRVKYGHCPAPIANTLQGQIQGAPPASTENGDCVILTEMPGAEVKVPSGLDTASVMEIALELNGMSPNQARDFRSLFDWRSALAIAAPRAMRSYQMSDVAGVRAMLMISAGRREPAYSLVWARDGIVYTLAGYGGSGDAVPLAASVR
jgi:hypothetical protein